MTTSSLGQLPIPVLQSPPRVPATRAPAPPPPSLDADSLRRPTMFSQLLPLLLLSAVPQAASASPDLRLHHRIFHPSLHAAPYVERAALHISRSGPAPTASLVPSEAYSDDFRQLLASAEGLPDALYQVALERPGDTDQAQWATSSVLAVSPPHSSRRPHPPLPPPSVPPLAARAGQPPVPSPAHPPSSALQRDKCSSPACSARV